MLIVCFLGWLFIVIISGAIKLHDLRLFLGWGGIFKVLSVILVFLGVNFLWAYLKYYFYRYALTDYSIDIESGIIYKRRVSIPYDRIQNVDIYRSPIERIFNLSVVLIHTAGYGASGMKGGGSEGSLPGLLASDAEQLRQDLLSKMES